MEVDFAQGSITPSCKLFFISVITKLGSTFKLWPIPSHSSHAPKGELNENNLGSISSIVKPLSGQENFEEKVTLSIFLNFFGSVSFSYSTINNPFERLTAVSTLSANLLPSLLFKIIYQLLLICRLIFLFKLENHHIYIFTVHLIYKTLLLN